MDDNKNSKNKISREKVYTLWGLTIILFTCSNMFGGGGATEFFLICGIGLGIALIGTILADYG